MSLPLQQSRGGVSYDQFSLVRRMTIIRTNRSTASCRLLRVNSSKETP